MARTFQFEMVPSRVAKAKSRVFGLKAVPVGLPVPLPLAGGTVIARLSVVPFTLYKVEKPVTWLFTHHSFSLKWLLDGRDSPHGFTRRESCAVVTIFDTV